MAVSSGMLSARRQFLDAFLGALGAAEIMGFLERESEVRGTIRFADDSEVLDLSGDEGEVQDFVWKVREEDAPSQLAYRIAEVLQRYRLLHLDKLRVSRATLREVVRKDDEDETMSDGVFELALEELLAIQVTMVDDGEETDVFFIRE